MDVEEAIAMLLGYYRSEVRERGHDVVFDTPTVHAVSQMVLKLTQPIPRSLLFCGQPGNGKTTMMYALHKMISYLSSSGKLEHMQIQDSWLRRLEIRSAVDIARNATDDYETLKSVRAYPMLGIDDLGAEPAEIQVFGNIINPMVEVLEYRYRRDLFTCITTNLPPSKIREVYGERLADRFNEMFDVIVFANKSYRPYLRSRNDNANE